MAKLYKNSRDGLILGVCTGIAESTGMKLGTVNLIFIIAILIFGLLALLVYFFMGLLLPEKPGGENNYD